MKLRPIETAPTDGTYLLLFGDSDCLDAPLRCEVGCWCKKKNKWLRRTRRWYVAFADRIQYWCPLPGLPEAEVQPPETAEMLEFFLGQMQMHSPKMDGQHGWRFSNDWPATHCVGPTPEAAVQAAIAEVKRRRRRSTP